MYCIYIYIVYIIHIHVTTCVLMETYGTHPKWKAHIGKKVRTLCLICTSNYFYNIYIYTVVIDINVHIRIMCI
jgi:hypothetical protein